MADDIRVAPSSQKYCSCKRNMPYFDWSHDKTCELYVPLNPVAPNSEPSIPAQPTVAVNVPEDEVGECGMCGGSGEIRAIDHGDVPCPTCVSREKREQLGRAEDRIAELAKTVARRESMLDRLSESNDNQLRRIAELESTIRWTLGENGEFRERGPKEGAYWWRNELRSRAALAAPSGVTKCPDCGGNFELCRCHRT